MNIPPDNNRIPGTNNTKRLFKTVYIIIKAPIIATIIETIPDPIFETSHFLLFPLVLVFFHLH